MKTKQIVIQNSDIRILNEALALDNYGIIVDKGNEKLLEIINRVIIRLKEEGKIEEYVLKHSSN